jgi:uncharacterized membrane protein
MHHEYKKRKECRAYVFYSILYFYSLFNFGEKVLAMAKKLERKLSYKGMQ